MMVVRTVSKDDDLQRLVEEINAAAWDDGNEISTYDAKALRNYLEHQGTVFVTCHEMIESNQQLLGIASSRLEVKPYDGQRWLYVDEVDVCSDKRRKGAGSALMRKLIEIAEQAGCEEVWLGADHDNEAANALYRSLTPDDVAQVVGYTYELDD